MCVNTGAAYVEEERGLQGGDQPSVTLATLLQCQHSVCVRDEGLNKGSPMLGVILKQRRAVGGFVAPLRLCVLQHALQVARIV